MADTLRALAIAALALPGCLPGSRGVPDPCALLVWLALVAPAAGALAGGARLACWPWAALVPGAWMLALVAVDALGPRDLPTPVWPALAWTGLFALGHALGRATPPGRIWRNAAALLALAALLTLLPEAGLALRAPWSGPVAARLLDLSPATLLCETAGLDWLRHPLVYDAAGSVDIDPSLRTAFRPALASAIVFVLGCAAAATCERTARAREARVRADAGPVAHVT